MGDKVERVLFLLWFCMKKGNFRRKESSICIIGYDLVLELFGYFWFFYYILNKIFSLIIIDILGVYLSKG